MNQTNNNTRNTGGPEPGGNSDKHPIYLADYPGEALLFTTGGVMVTRKNDVNVTQTRPVNIIQLEDEREKKETRTQFKGIYCKFCYRLPGQQGQHTITVFPLLYSL